MPRLKKSALPMTIRACASAAWVNLYFDATSPQAKMRALVCAQLVVDLDTEPVEIDARRFQAKTIGVRGAADGNENRVGRDLNARPVRGLGDDHLLTDDLFTAFLLVGFLDFGDLDAQVQLDAVVVERLLDDGGGVRVLARKHVLGDIENRHLGAETRERLRHLAADRAGADHRETARQLRDGKNRFVGQIVDVGESRDRRRGGAGAGCDHRATELQTRGAPFAGVYLEGVRCHEATMAEENVDAQLAKTRRAVHRADRGA